MCSKLCLQAQKEYSIVAKKSALRISNEIIRGDKQGAFLYGKRLPWLNILYAV